MAHAQDIEHRQTTLNSCVTGHWSVALPLMNHCYNPGPLRSDDGRVATCVTSSSVDDIQRVYTLRVAHTLEECDRSGVHVEATDLLDEMDPWMKARCEQCKLALARRTDLNDSHRVVDWQRAAGHLRMG